MLIKQRYNHISLHGFLFTAIIFVAILCFAPGSGWAALFFEGRLFDGKHPVNAGKTVTLTLRIFDKETGGTLLYEESQETTAETTFSKVAFEQGKITVKKRLAGIAADKLWVEIEYSDHILTPRLSLAELGSLNELQGDNVSIRQAHLRASGAATLVIDNNGVSIGGTLDMGGEAIKLGGVARTSWPSGSSSGNLEARIAALEYKLAHFTRSGNDIYVTNANLHIRSGSGQTYGTVNGLGNLIIGYNEGRYSSDGADDRTGSHNLILGRCNNYTSYGGLVAGYLNTINNKYATIAGGDHNIVSGAFSCILGGYYNRASAVDCIVCGGTYNSASGRYSSVLGGGSNAAKASHSTVSGGNTNTAEGHYSSVTGGLVNFASGEYDCILGGNNNHANGEASTIYGGQYRYTTKKYEYAP
jgi:hypothetical protein